jgi:hypothetical protein
MRSKKSIDGWLCLFQYYDTTIANEKKGEKTML